MFWHVFLDVKMITLRRDAFFFFFPSFTDGGISKKSEHVAQEKTTSMISLFGDRQVEMCVISFSAV